MRSGRVKVAAAAAGVALALAGAWVQCGRRAGTNALQSQITVLEQQRSALRARIDELMANDPRLEGMPETPLRVSVPTELLRQLVERLVAGLLDRVSLVLTDIQTRKQGEVKKLLTLGAYDLHVNIDSVSGRLKAGRPEIRFGGNRIDVTLPIVLESGRGRATLDFRWDGKNVSDALCGDLTVRRIVTGRVQPARYQVRGFLGLSATPHQIVATPHFPVTRIALGIEPSAESWHAIQEILDRKTGVCGFLLDKVDVPAALRGLLEKGIEVRLPTEKLGPVAAPVALEPSLSVKDKPIALTIRLGGFALTERSLWFGAFIEPRPPLPN